MDVRAGHLRSEGWLRVSAGQMSSINLLLHAANPLIVPVDDVFCDLQSVHRSRVLLPCASGRVKRTARVISTAELRLSLVNFPHGCSDVEHLRRRTVTALALRRPRPTSFILPLLPHFV